MRLLDNLLPRTSGEVRSASNLSWPGGDSNAFWFGGPAGSHPEIADGTFVSMVQTVHEKSGVVSAAVFARSLLLSQVRFTNRKIGASPIISVDERQVTRDLARLERPGSMTRPQMLKRMEQDVSYAGNAFVVPGRGRKLHRLQPHKVSFILGSDMEPTWDGNDEMVMPYDAEVLAIAHNPSDISTNTDNVTIFRKGEFVHWMPEPDPLHFWRGSSWVQSLLRDVSLEGQIDDHQASFFEHAATPRMVFIADGTRTQDELTAAAQAVNQEHAGSGNAYKNMFIGGISDVRTIGQDFSKIGFKDLRGSIEIATAMRSRIPASILGTSDSLEGSSLNAGNYSAARRMWADGWFTPTVEDLCSSLEAIAPPPSGQELGADLSHVLFLQEDSLDQSVITQTQMAAIRNAVDGGFTAESATAAVVSGDLGKLVHSGLLSVQLQPAGTVRPEAAPSPDNRVVMGRLGRATTLTDVDASALCKGLSDEVKVLVSGVLAAHTSDDIATLRAEMLAALNGDTNE